MTETFTNQQGNELDPKILNSILEGFIQPSVIEKWDMGASLSRDISVQVQQGNAKQLKGSQIPFFNY